MRILILAYLTFLFNNLYSQTNIGGIINTYTTPTAFNACENSATVPDVTGISAGDFVLIIQMKGADINQSNTAAYGNIQNYQSAGLYEVAQIASVGPNTITFVNALINQYDVNGLVQFVICPNYTNVTVTSTLTAPAWNGTVGGVVFLHAGSVSLSAPIDVTGLGFRGGLPSEDYYLSSNCATSTYTTTIELGGYKGEGIFSTSNANSYGRGKNANGGGGGNNLNAGGGGGGNAGSGGKGGNQWTGCGLAVNGGLGGAALNFTDRLFLGGGGGGGHQNNSESTTGGKGGGIIVVETNALSTNGNPIRSNGASVTIVAGIDAAGGGGGGGAILIQSPAINGNLVIEAKGGNGGNVNNGYTGGGTGGQCHGTGGGGGGGFIAISSSGTPTVSNNLAGGTGGQSINIQSDCYNQNYGSESGLSGLIVYNQVIPESTQPTNPAGNISISSSIIPNLCGATQDGQITLSVSPPSSYVYSWSHDPSLNGPVASGLASGSYSVQISDGSCIYDTTIVIPAMPGINAVTAVVQNACNAPGSIEITGIAGGTIPYSTSINGITYTPAMSFPGLSAGTYTIYLKDGNGCSYDTSLTISPYESDPFEVDYSSQIPVCGQNGFFMINEVSGGFSPYQYAFDGSSYSSNLIFPYSESDSIVLTIIDSVGCSFDYPVLLQGSTEPETLHIPNCFTPQGDEANPTWFVTGDCVAEFECFILNRWGEIVYESTDLNGHWDGTFSGKMCMEAVYFYKVHVKHYSGKTGSYHGNVTLIR